MTPAECLARMSDSEPLISALGAIVPGYHVAYPSRDSRGCAVVRVDLPADLQLEVGWVCHVEDQPEIEAMIGRGRGELLRGTVAEVRSWLLGVARDLDGLVGGVS